MVYGRYIRIYMDIGFVVYEFICDHNLTMLQQLGEDAMMDTGPTCMLAESVT